MLMKGNGNFCSLGGRPSWQTKKSVAVFESLTMSLVKQPHYLVWPWCPNVYIMKYTFFKWVRLKYMFSLKFVYVISANVYEYLRNLKFKIITWNFKFVLLKLLFEISMFMIYF